MVYLIKAIVQTDFPHGSHCPVHEFLKAHAKAEMNMMTVCMTDQYFHDNIAYHNKCLCFISHSCCNMKCS